MVYFYRTLSRLHEDEALTRAREWFEMQSPPHSPRSRLATKSGLAGTPSKLFSVNQLGLISARNFPALATVATLSGISALDDGLLVGHECF